MEDARYAGERHKDRSSGALQEVGDLGQHGQRTQMTGIRCFVAVDLPEEMREKVGPPQSKIATEGLRLVRPDLVHVTIKFLGDVPAEKVERVKKALAAVRAAPFTARLVGMGAFPGRSVRVVWLGLEGDFSLLSANVQAATESLGFPPEERGFTPHVTIGRVGRPNAGTSRELLAKISLAKGS